MSRWVRMIAWFKRVLLMIRDSRAAAWVVRMCRTGFPKLYRGVMLSRPVQWTLRKLFGLSSGKRKGKKLKKEKKGRRILTRAEAASGRTTVPTRPDAEEFFAQIADPDDDSVPTRSDAAQFFAELENDIPEAAPAPSRKDAAAFFAEISTEKARAVSMRAGAGTSAVLVERAGGDAPETAEEDADSAEAERNPVGEAFYTPEEDADDGETAEDEKTAENEAESEGSGGASPDDGMAIFHQARYAPDEDTDAEGSDADGETPEDTPDAEGSDADGETPEDTPDAEGSDADGEAPEDTPDAEGSDADGETPEDTPDAEGSDADGGTPEDTPDAEGSDADGETPEDTPDAERSAPYTAPMDGTGAEREEDSLQAAMRIRWNEVEAMTVGKNDLDQPGANRRYGDEDAEEDGDEYEDGYEDEYGDDEPEEIPERRSLPVRILQGIREPLSGKWSALKSRFSWSRTPEPDEDEFDDFDDYDEYGEGGLQPIRYPAKSGTVEPSTAAESEPAGNTADAEAGEKTAEAGSRSENAGPAVESAGEPAAAAFAAAASVTETAEAAESRTDADTDINADIAAADSESDSGGTSKPENAAVPANPEGSDDIEEAEDSDGTGEGSDADESADHAVRRRRVTRLEGLLAAYQRRDPAARSKLEVFLLYPGVQAILWHRAAHWLYTHHRLFLARGISQWSRFWTGIEIHPGAKIGRRLVIDHGMGVIIGETTEIGDDCLLYQGVTLGGTGKDQGKRHPTLGNNVLVGSGAKILGPFTVGDNARIAAGAVVLRAVPPNSTAVGVPAQIVRVAGEPVFYTDDVDQTSVANPTLERIAALAARVETLERKLDMPTEPMHTVDEYDDYVI